MAKSESDKYGYHIHYAIKANSQPRILSEVKHAGFGIDCLSGQEIQHALDNGFSSNNIAFAGVENTIGKLIWQ